MAKRTIQVMTDDLDGGDAARTIKFTFDGIEYEIDLSEKNAEKFRDAVAPYTAAARRLGRGAYAPRFGGRGASSAAAAASERDQRRAIREWAQARGHQIADRGRIKQEIIDEFHATAGRTSAE